MQLQNRALYQFDTATASIYRGRCFIADQTLSGFALYTRAEWDVARSDPHLVIDGRGRILRRGIWTGYTVEELVRVRDIGADAASGHGDLGRYSRPHRCDHGAIRVIRV